MADVYTTTGIWAGAGDPIIGYLPDGREVRKGAGGLYVNDPYDGVIYLTKEQERTLRLG